MESKAHFKIKVIKIVGNLCDIRYIFLSQDNNRRINN